MTYYQLIKEIRTWAAAHLQINHEGYGEEFDMDGAKREAYPIFWIDSNARPRVNFDRQEYDIRFYCLGKPLTEGTKEEISDNNLRIQSDTLEILRDLLAELRFKQNYFQSEGATLEIGNSTFTDYYEDKHQELTGWVLDLTIIDSKPLDNCNPIV